MQVGRMIPPWLLLIALGTAVAQSDKQKLWENAANYASDNQRCSALPPTSAALGSRVRGLNRS